MDSRAMTGAYSGTGLQEQALKRTVRIAVMVVLTAVGAQLAVRLPFTPVPVTMQTLFVVLAGIALGPRDGFYAMVSYLALGAAGVPLFAEFSFGPAILAGPTGGYLLAFPAAALLAGGSCRVIGGGRLATLAGALSGSWLILLSGTLYLSLLPGISLKAAVSLGLVPFIAGDIVKAAMAAFMAGRRS